MTFAALTRARRGQGATEYVVIVGLCALLLVSAVQALRTSVFNSYEKATLTLASTDPSWQAPIEVSAENPFRPNRIGVWMDTDGTFVADTVVRPFEPDPAVWAAVERRRHR